ncbi:hypothetical protein JNB62_15860 [Microbacterium jejuense]|uniref:Helix-turn-helix domain-containing protein n=1 Tax=Microbacterium jejuense TaxID=1263637 RepID=A0ABS7HQB5_9MICO|nr:helix-turn-helix domain-containing protein [Microbacterium jejuense]MBW9095162.1 hypothetical protein [Microbacterium jejuense]
MSIHHLEQAAEIDLHATTKLVLMALCDDASKETRVAHPGMQKMLTWSGAKERRVQQIVDELIGRGLVARTAFAFPGRRAEFLVFPTPAEYSQLDEIDPRLNAGHPVDNPSEMGAVGCGRPNAGLENGCNLHANGCNPDCTPPVSTPLTITGQVPEVPTDANALAAGTGPKPTPATVSATYGHPLHHADVFASVGTWLPSTFDDAQLDALADEIIAAARPARVFDPTAYVIQTIRNTVRTDERRRGRWLIRADEIALEHAELTQRGARF